MHKNQNTFHETNSKRKKIKTMVAKEKKHYNEDSGAEFTMF